jgi:tRNA-Thr(GGU) m(6)t(6)A37 methyltransferase TsaA
MSQDDQQSSWSVQAIGRVSSSRTEAIDDDWGGITATITLLQPFGPDALVGLDEFSHLEVIYLFDRVDPDTVNRGARIPRNNPAWPAVGIFAQRAKNRPNRLGLATCELVAVDGATVRVRGLDAIDGTPVLDIKPYMPPFDRMENVKMPEWVGLFMDGYF